MKFSSLCVLPLLALWSSASLLAQSTPAELEAQGTDAAHAPLASTPDPARRAAALGAMASTGILLIPDSSNRRVMALDPASGDLIDADFIPADATNLTTPIEAVLDASNSRILISDQVADVVQSFDLASGLFVGTFAPAGGVNTAILDNIRGIQLQPNGHLLVSVGSGANNNTVAEFDSGGNYLGNFVAAGAAGLNSPFDVYRVQIPIGELRNGDILVPGSSSSAIHRYAADGTPQANFASVATFPEQLLQARNGNLLVANFTGAQTGVLEFAPNGSLIGTYNPAGLSGYRGVHELANGNILTTTGTGVHEISRSGSLVRTVVSGVSARFISLVRLPEIAYGIAGFKDDPQLVRFPTNQPGAATVVGNFSGLAQGHELQAIDFRPANGRLYALSIGIESTNFRLYTVDLDTAQLTPVGSGDHVGDGLFPPVSIDFNPAVDRLRVATGSRQNFRVHPDTGALVAQDTDFDWAPGDPNDGDSPFLAAVAYDRNDNDPATATTMFAWDWNTDSLARVGSVDGSPVSPNSGQLNTILTPNQFITSETTVGMDVSGGGTAYLSYQPIGGGLRPADTEGISFSLNTVLSELRLNDGSRFVIGSFPEDMFLQDFSVQPAAAGVDLADLVVSIADNPDPVTAGTALTYQVDVLNDGPQDAEDVSLSLSLPAAVAFVSTAPGAGGSCTSPPVGSSGTVSCTWAGTTANGASRQLSVVVGVPASTANGTILTATAIATSLTDDPEADNNEAGADTTVGTVADLAMSLSDSPDPVSAGGNLSYVATVNNGGPSDAQDVAFALPLAAGTSLVSATPSAGGNCAGVATVTCTWAGATVPGASRSATIVVLVAASVAQGSTLSATATASSATADSNPANNTATATTLVNAVADLAVALSASLAQAQLGQVVGFSATSTNLGPSDALAVQLSISLSPDFRYSSFVASPGASCTAPQVGNSGVIACTWAGATAPAAVRSLSVDAVSFAPGSSSIQAATSSTTSDPLLANNTANVIVLVGSPVEPIPTMGRLGLLLLGLMVGLLGMLAIRRS